MERANIDVDARIQAAEPIELLVQARPCARPHSPRAPYHEPIALELEEDLRLSIGKGIAIAATSEHEPPEDVVRALANYIDTVRAGRVALPRDVDDAVLALGCAFGHALCRAFGYGWGHLRRTRAPGIVVISRDRSYAIGPRTFVTAALENDGGAALLDMYRRLGNPASLPRSKPGSYLRLDAPSRRRPHR